MDAWRVATAKALDPVLAEVLSLNGLPLVAVKQLVDEGCVDSIRLDFGSVCLVIKANPEDDSIDTRVESPCDYEVTGWIDVSDHHPWRDYTGKSFGWGWVTVNQQGYWDGLLLGFENAVPQIVLNVAASSIKTGLIHYLPGHLNSTPGV
jgi:Family of unknown function (DUF6334)